MVGKQTGKTELVNCLISQAPITHSLTNIVRTYRRVVEALSSLTPMLTPPGSSPLLFLFHWRLELVNIGSFHR